MCRKPVKIARRELGQDRIRGAPLACGMNLTGCTRAAAPPPSGCWRVEACGRPRQSILWSIVPLCSPASAQSVPPSWHRRTAPPAPPCNMPGSRRPSLRAGWVLRHWCFSEKPSLVTSACVHVSGANPDIEHSISRHKARISKHTSGQRAVHSRGLQG